MAELVRPAVRYVASLVEAMHEGFSRDTMRIETPEAIAAIEADPEGFVRLLLDPPTTIVLPDGSLGSRVPETVFWFVEDGAFLGLVGVRHALNAVLERWGGHIGYSVRPSARGRGHASAMLAHALAYARTDLGLQKVLLTVNTTNAASIRVIQKHGGVLADTIPHPWIEGDRGHRYWIDL